MPDFEALAGEFEGRVRFAVVTVERDSGVLEAFDAGSVPAYLVFRDGVEVDRLKPRVVGWVKRRLRSKVEAALSAQR